MTEHRENQDHNVEESTSASQGTLQYVPVSLLETRPSPQVVNEKDREGVFVHSFKCGNCSLHFVTFSWAANRHRVGCIRCPECGEKEHLLHWRATLSDSRTFDPSSTKEIYAVHPWPGSEVQSDSSS